MMSGGDDWAQSLEEAESASDFDERQARIERISSDPKPEYSEPVKKPYRQTEMHYILCVDEENANLSMPEAMDLYGQPHRLGNLLITDRFETPLGWIKSPGRGVSIEVIKGEYPEVYNRLVEKKVTNF